MNSRVLLLASLFGGIMTLSTKAQTITAPTGQNLTITNPVDVTGAGNGINIPTDGGFKIGGANALNMKGANNIFLGSSTGASITTGVGNSFMGAGAGFANTTGDNNMFIGTASGAANVSGFSNSFIGVNAGRNSTGNQNSFIGASTGFTTTSGSFNSAFGSGAAYLNTTGANNVFMGVNAGFNNTTGSNNTFIGSGADAGSGALSNATAIGYNTVVSASNTVVLGNGATTITGTGLSNASGLRFPNLTSGSTATAVGGNKVLSVDATGNVVLVTLSSGTINSVGGPTGPVVENTWKESDGYLYNNSTNGVVINGTGLDGNSLIVKGGVLSKEVNVKVEGAESWPDYVFKPSYKRMSLDEVEKFININGHLPNVASAAEMANTGNNLNKTDIKLLEKVEELTLYLLEMKKANEAQNAEIQNLKKQVKSLRKK
jgi:trimeric autotransporter adhesin